MQKIISITYKCDCCGKEFKRSEELVKEHEKKCFKNKAILDKWNGNKITLEELLNYYILENCYYEESKIDAITLLTNYNTSITKSELLNFIKKCSEDDLKGGIFAANNSIYKYINSTDLMEVVFKLTKNETESYLKMPNFILNLLIPYIMKFNNLDPYIIKTKNIMNLDELNSILNKGKPIHCEVKNGIHNTNKLIIYGTRTKILISDDLSYFPLDLIDCFTIIKNETGNIELVAKLNDNNGNKVNKLICKLY